MAGEGVTDASGPALVIEIDTDLSRNVRARAIWCRQAGWALSPEPTMFHTLIASGPQPEPDVPRFLSSVALHGIVVAAAIASTRPTAPAPPEAVRESSLVFIAPQAATRPVASLPDLPGRPAPAPSWHALVEVPALGAVQLLPALPTVSDILSEVAPSSSARAAAATAAGTDRAPWAADSVDDPVEVLDQAPVPYPPAMAQAAIPGSVDVEFVVDTSGRAEPNSIRTLASTRPEFEAAARAAIISSRYRPARAHGNLVRQLVRQTLSFRAERGLARPPGER
jgi:TonB family protein